MTTPELRYTAYGPTLSGDYTMGELYDGEHTRIIASFNTRADADRIAAKLNQHAAADTDYLNLFAAYDNLKREYAALQTRTDSAIDTLQADVTEAVKQGNAWRGFLYAMAVHPDMLVKDALALFDVIDVDNEYHIDWMAETAVARTALMDVAMVHYKACGDCTDTLPCAQFMEDLNGAIATLDRLEGQRPQ